MRFRLKMTLGMLCLMALLFGAGGSLLVSLSFDSALEREKEAALESYRAILDTLSAASALGTWTGNDDLGALLDQLHAGSASTWSALRLATPDGMIHESGPPGAPFVDDRSGIREGAGTLLVRTSGEGAPAMQLSGVCLVDGEPLYLDAVRDLAPLYEARDSQRTAFRVVFALLVACCAGLAYGMSRLLTRPLARLSTASRELATGNLAFRSNVRSDDEIGRLSEDFDAMAGQLERGMAELRRALERQERFTGSFAHEVKTPMTSIIGYADLLRRDVLDDRERREAAQYVFSEGKRLENLSLKLLDLFVLGKAEPALEPHELGALLRDVTDAARPVCERGGATLACRCEEGCCLLDADLVRSLALNLVENARKAVGQGGHIVVTGTMLPDGCRIQVDDDGKGIPAEALAHLTEAFYRADAARSRADGGTGLGLPLCAKIAELHGGTLRVESEPDRGTRVTAELRGGRP